MIENGFDYHFLTAYSRGRIPPHRLDFANQPFFFKNYPEAVDYRLPNPENWPQISLTAAVKAGPGRFCLTGRLEQLAALLQLASALTGQAEFAGNRLWYRSNPSAGALQPLDLYLLFPGRADLPRGQFYYDPSGPRLRRLNGRDLAADCRAALPEPESGPESAFLVISAVYFRSAWKYRDRSFRYLLLDAGHLLENLLLGLSALGLDYRLRGQFDDQLINRLLGFESAREAALMIVKLPLAEGEVEQRADSQAAEIVVSEPAAEREITYQLLGEVYQATAAAGDLTSQRCSSPYPEPELIVSMTPPAEAETPKERFALVNCLSRRRSRRNFRFGDSPLPRPILVGLLRLLGGFAPDSVAPGIALRLSHVEGLADGLYSLSESGLGLVKSDDCHHEVARAALDQRWLAQANLLFLFFAEPSFWKPCPRAYRDLQMAAGRLGQRLYLGAEAWGLGCCGVGAFYDRELAEVYDLSHEFSPLYLVAVGLVAGLS